MPIRNERLDFIDSLKGISILAVVIVHVNAQLITDVQNNVHYDNFSKTFLILLSYLARYCVPIFIMATGYLLWNKQFEPTFTRLLKTLSSIIVIYLIWSMVYILPKHNGEESIYTLIVLGKSAPQMYYIPTIYIPVVVVMTFIRKISYSVYALLACCILFPAMQIFYFTPNKSSIGFVLFYAVIGALFNYVDINNKRVKKFILLCSILSLCFYLITSYQMIDYHQLNNVFKTNLFFKIKTLAYAFFIFSMFFVYRISFKPLNILGKYSTSIFFQHWLLYIYAYSLWVPYAKNSGFLFYPLVIVMYLSISFLPLLFKKFGRDI